MLLATDSLSEELRRDSIGQLSASRDGTLGWRHLQRCGLAVLPVQTGFPWRRNDVAGSSTLRYRVCDSSHLERHGIFSLTARVPCTDLDLALASPSLRLWLWLGFNAEKSNKIVKIRSVTSNTITWLCSLAIRGRHLQLQPSRYFLWGRKFSFQNEIKFRLADKKKHSIKMPLKIEEKKNCVGGYQFRFLKR